MHFSSKLPYFKSDKIAKYQKYRSLRCPLDIKKTKKLINDDTITCEALKAYNCTNRFKG